MAKNKLPAILLCLAMLFAVVKPLTVRSASATYTVAQVQSLCDGIVAYNGSGSGQDFIDGYLSNNAGVMSEFYVIALSQSGNYDFSRYESALLSYLDTHEVYSAASREKYALALSASGSTDRYISDVADEAIGGLGIMSLVFGLHLLNNGYDSALYSTDGLVSEILSKQKSDGGWAVMGSYGDVDVTAMTLQALAPHCGRSDVGAAVDSALALLSGKQLDSGGFMTMGAENCESAAQVIIALSALGIDAQYDDRFIKNGNTAMDGMMQYYVGDGSFSHTGGGGNDNATEEAFCALTAYCRMCYGQGSLYLLDHTTHSSPEQQSGSPSQKESGSGGKNSGGSGNSSDHRPDHSGSSGGSGSSDTGASYETEENGNRVIIINGQRFIEATTPSGEKVTVAVSETQPEQSATIVRPTFGAFQPSATADTSAAIAAATADESGGTGGYKLYAILGVIGAAGIACAVLFLLKKRNKKNFIAVAVIAAAGVLFLLLTDFKSPQSYAQPAKTDGELTVTLSIRCDTITGREKVNRYVPEDGEILAATTFSADEGDTVYDVLMQASRANHITVDNRGASGAAYIAGINSLYEFDYGDLSGWMYRVNGEFPDVGCQSYTVSDGDKIEWLYTTDIGKDLE